MQKLDSEVTFDPKAEYNFQLEKLVDEKVLVKKLQSAQFMDGEKTRFSGRSKEYRPCIWNNPRCGDHQKVIKTDCRKTR